MRTGRRSQRQWSPGHVISFPPQFSLFLFLHVTSDLKGNTILWPFAVAGAISDQHAREHVLRKQENAAVLPAMGRNQI